MTPCHWVIFSGRFEATKCPHLQRSKCPAHLSKPALRITQPPIQWVPGISREVNAAEAWRWPPTPYSAEVKEIVELYFYSASGPSWPVLGWSLPVPLPLPIPLPLPLMWLIKWLSVSYTLGPCEVRAGADDTVENRAHDTTQRNQMTFRQMRLKIKKMTNERRREVESE